MLYYVQLQVFRAGESNGAETLHVANTATQGKYLGLPTPEGRMNKNKFKSTKEKLVNKCTSWEEKHMPMGAKEVLIKAVA
jgi:hypothetical protein